MAASCRECGKNLRQNEIYCRYCGARQSVTPQERPPAYGGGAADSPAPELFVTPPPVPVMGVGAAPARLRGGWNPAATVAVVLVVVALALVGLLGFVTPGFFLASSSRTPSPSTPGGGLQPVAPTTSTAPITSFTPEYTVPTTLTTTSNTVPDDEAAAQSMLQRQVDEDRNRAESFVGSWLPQLSAKKPGMTVDGVVYDYRKTWSDFLDKRAQNPDAILLWSGEFTGFRYKDYWITMVPQPFSSGEGANDWCAGAGIGKDDCYAKRLTHGGGYEGNTLLRK